MYKSHIDSIQAYLIFMSLTDVRQAAQSWKRSIPTNIIAGHELSEIISTLQVANLTSNHKQIRTNNQLFNVN